MAKVFTITPGLENMGAMKTGGQGSVYKGRRIGEVITAIKILPTPIYSESDDDKNFLAFQNEVDKLRKVNEQPNPNVVKILSSGLTDTGNLPFIEMEFIHGPDLEDLLKAPNDPVFTVKEVLKVAEQLSNALAHCHSLDVKHGDIKSNNVKFNTGTSNYVLLDFGLAMMSDEQRRSSLRQAGAIEFMAPEQNTGQMLFQTDIYSFGVVLFELLAGRVPFPLKDRGESARNEVRLAHMVTPLPDLMELRQDALPSAWDDQKKAHELQVPGWLLGMISKCLSKKPEARFANGVELHEFISEKSVSADYPSDLQHVALLEQENKQLLASREQLQQQLEQYIRELDKKDQQLLKLEALLQQKDNELQLLRTKEGKQPGSRINGSKSVPAKTFIGLLLCTIVLSAFIFFSFLKSRPSGTSAANRLQNSQDTAVYSGPVVTGKKKIAARKVAVVRRDQPAQQVMQASDKTDSRMTAKQKDKTTAAETGDQKKLPKAVLQKPAEQNSQPTEERSKPTADDEDQSDDASETIPAPTAKDPRTDSRTNERVTKQYLVISKAFFYNAPDESTRSNAFIDPRENAVVEAKDDRYGFIYVVIKNPQGQVFRGWLRKVDMKLYSIQ